MRSTIALLAAAIAFNLPARGSPDLLAQTPRGVMPNLGRPTQAEDKIPLFNFDEYFTGRWTFEWIVPESPLGPAGEVTGATTFKPIDARFYQADTEAKGPAGPFKIREKIAYHAENKTIVRQVTDSRGFSYLTLATVGADLAGIYYIYFESEPFTVRGKTIRIKENWRLVSPVNNKVTLTVSADGGRFLNYGSPWWQKQISAIKN